MLYDVFYWQAPNQPIGSGMTWIDRLTLFSQLDLAAVSLLLFSFIAIGGLIEYAPRAPLGITINGRAPAKLDAAYGRPGCAHF